MNVDVVINLKARRGSEAVARKVQAELPQARVITSRTLAEASRFARMNDSGRSSLLLSAGGDGTAVALLNELRGVQIPSLGVLPLGTGNGWAHATGAPRWRRGLEQLGGLLRRQGAVPMRRFELVQIDIDGLPSRIAHFAGTGWDAEIINDFNAQKTGRGILPKAWRHGLAGYMQGLFLRTIPRGLGAKIPEVEITNLGSAAMTVDDAGQPMPLEAGAVIYRGPTNVCAAGTSENWGFGFRAFPHAGLVPGRFCLRVYSGTTLQATLAMRRLWRGAHPQPRMHSFFVDHVRCVFSRPVALQIGGDSLGNRTEIEYRLAPEKVDLLDWRRLASA
jgi:diacylglycerol kinase family enzyme